MTASTTSTPTAVPTYRDHWEMLGGDRFYTLARWSVVVLLFATGRLLTNAAIWPPSLLMPPILLVIWGYAIFALLTTIALFIPLFMRLLRISFMIDIVFITLLVLFSRDPNAMLYPLYILPLVGAALRERSATGLLAGVIAAGAYILAYLFAHAEASPRLIGEDRLTLVALILRAAMLILFPWLTSGLAERRTSANRRSIAQAEQNTARAWDEANAYREQMRSLYEVAYTLSTTMNYQGVLDVTLVESRKLVPHVCGIVLLSTGQPDELYIAAAYGLNESDKAQRIKLASGRIAQVLRSADPMLIENVSREAELQPISALAMCRAACLVPLRAALHSYGVLLIASNQTAAFNQEQLGMLTALANYSIIALHNAQLVYDLREERTKLLSKEEEIRHQLARDLHDGPAQALAAITMGIEFIKRLLQRDPERVVSELDKLGSLAKRTTHEVRTMLFELRPLVLETQGLDTTLRQYFERFQGNGTEIILESTDVRSGLDTKTEGTLFNIIQESVNNALKHAKAQHIWVRLKQTPTTLEATVQDDGRGFDLQKVRASYEQRGSFGLLNIDERAKRIGGIAEMQSAPGEGTTVHVVVPLS